MPNRLKPIPKNQSEITQQAINEPYLANQGKPVSETVFSRNRGTDYSMKDDTVKDISVGLEDIDNAIMYYFENVIKPNVIQNGQQIAVPVIYGSAERWKLVQADGFYRDMNGAIQLPLIMFKRENVEKNRNIGNKLDGNTAHLYQVVGSKYNKRNAYDLFDVINNRIPSEQYYISVVPDYVTLTYNCIVFTNFIEQNNKIVEAIEYASDSYWGDPARWKFKASIDSFATTTLLENASERAAKSTFTIKVNGYIIPNTVNKTMATARSKFYTKSQVVFTMETTDDIKTLNSMRNLSGPKTAMGAAVGVADSYNVNITNTNISGVSNDIVTYLNTNKTVLATTVTTSTATFPNGTLTAPSPLPAISVANFTFFVNGQLIEPAAISGFTDNGNGTSTLTVNTTELGFSLSSTNDEVVGIGKFAS
jgi:hypothetical protein